MLSCNLLETKPNRTDPSSVYTKDDDVYLDKNSHLHVNCCLNLCKICIVSLSYMQCGRREDIVGIAH